MLILQRSDMYANLSDLELQLFFQMFITLKPSHKSNSHKDINRGDGISYGYADADGRGYGKGHEYGNGYGNGSGLEYGYGNIHKFVYRYFNKVIEMDMDSYL